MWGNDLLSGGETQLIYVSPAGISLLLLSLFISCLRMPVLPHRPFSSHRSFLTRTWEEGDAAFTEGCPLPPNIRTQSAVVSRHSSFYACWLCSFITVLPAEQMLYILNHNLEPLVF